MYAMIPAVWVTSKNTVREQCLRFVMNKENQNTHIIVGENVDTKYKQRALQSKWCIKIWDDMVFDVSVLI